MGDLDILADTHADIAGGVLGGDSVTGAAGAGAV